jgi:hypothetical protein
MTCAERRLALALALGAALGCGSAGRRGADLPDTTRNVVPVSVDGARCGSAPALYVNEPCVSVTVCTPGTQSCQTVDGVLLDTGSFGLRLFKQVLTVPLAPVASGGGELAECVQFGDQTADWGPVRRAGVVLGGEPAVQVPIQVIDAAYPGLPSSCPSPDTDPAMAGFNGILGVGAFAADCGEGCASDAGSGLYFSCSGGTCAGAAVPVGDQVTNPVAALPQDDNGVVVELPAVPGGGAGSVEGSMLLGIGTARNNVPGTVTVLDLDGSGEFRTSLAGAGAIPAFADTGSNALFFPAPPGGSLPVCASDAHWYCPPGGATLSATNRGASGRGSAAVTFQVANFERLSASSAVFSDLAGPGLASGGFDWGLPFFFGRPVYVGLEGRSSPLGGGPYVAH